MKYLLILINEFSCSFTFLNFSGKGIDDMFILMANFKLEFIIPRKVKNLSPEDGEKAPNGHKALDSDTKNKQVNKLPRIPFYPEEATHSSVSDTEPNRETEKKKPGRQLTEAKVEELIGNYVHCLY